MYKVNEPRYGFLAEEVIKARLSPEQNARLYEHALALACLDGNSFGEELVEQYIPEAYANLWNNSSLDDLPLLYPSTASEAYIASLPLKSPQSGEITLERRSQLRALFKVNPSGDAYNLAVILDKAEAVLGTEEAAEDWVDQYSHTLGGVPRELSNTSDGTNRVLRHLSSISHAGGVDV